MSRDPDPDRPVAWDWLATVEQAARVLAGIFDRLDDHERAVLRAAACSLIQAVDDYTRNKADLLDRLHRFSECSD